MAPLAVILGCSGPTLTEEERDFFTRHNPLGFILFGRNIKTPEQVAALVGELRATVGREDAPVLIDQEGGRVQRLHPPHWRKAPPGAVFATLARRDIERARHALYLNNRLIAADLVALGIDVDCTPVLDVPVSGAHDVIGDRAFGEEPGMVADLGGVVCKAMLDGGVIPIVKHVPGHGRAMVDSHLDLPVVDATLEELRRRDFAPFATLKDAPWAMTAHVVYRAIDANAPATTSRRVIEEIVRGEIGFDGLLLSDDLSMKALKGDFGARTAASLEAGCDVVLHCNGDMAEMKAIVAAATPMTDAALARLARGAAMRASPKGPETMDRTAALAELESLLA
ncbi:beta-N-acetylhexosaminidase [Telmatospirillum sp. J64-1]|uniref:beta-N-acetylhexosaminidase n=1 Tax=Telmatospirillum sp. J64-1 TaxID=2502183 RepID=UPI00115DB4CE|nr:beta-N-acetylhexosaminidase [Telmatospirillum sp. J64-1]